MSQAVSQEHGKAIMGRMRRLRAVDALPDSKQLGRPDKKISVRSNGDSGAC